MSSARAWDTVTAFSLPALLLGVGLLPPHVYPSLTGALALGGLLAALGIAGADRLPSPRAGASLPLLAAIALSLLSACLALQPMRSFRVLIIWLVGGVVFAAARSAGRGIEVRRAVSAIVLLATLLAGLGLYQSIVAFPRAGEDAASGAPTAGGGGGGAAVPAAARTEEDRAAGKDDGAVRARLRSGRAVGTVGLPALLASILILGIPLAAASALAARGPARAVWGIAAAIQIAGLVATRSIGGASALLISAAACAPLWTDLRPALRRGVIAAILIAAAGAAAPRLVRSGEGSASSALLLRTENWRAGLSMAVSHPLLGVGPDNYGVAYPQHRSSSSNETQHAHNSYLEIVADVGLPIAPLLALAIAALLRSAGEVSRRRGCGPSALWRGRALAVACVAWAAQNAVDFSAYVAASVIPFLAAAGLLLREARAGADSDSSESSGERGYARAGVGARALFLAAAALGPAVAVPDSFAARHIESAAEDAARGDFDLASREAEAASQWNPFDPEARVVLAQSLIDKAIGLPQAAPERRASVLRAVVEAEEAVRLDPATANRRAALARARSAAGDTAGSYAAMAAAARLNPFRPAYAIERDELRSVLTGEKASAPQRVGPP